jgi:hypothetical protein
MPYTRPTPTGSPERRLPAGGGGIAVNRTTRPRPPTATTTRTQSSRELRTMQRAKQLDKIGEARRSLDAAYRAASARGQHVTMLHLAKARRSLDNAAAILKPMVPKEMRRRR